jgi:hypothetical protein
MRATLSRGVGKAWGMSALERFVRARQYRSCAADYYEMAAGAFSVDVRTRYLAIADHYTALADAELRSDRLERKKRLAEMRAAREKRAAAAKVPSPDPMPSRSLQPIKLRVIQGTKHSTRESRADRRPRLAVRS